MSGTKISVIVTIYNTEKYLDKCISSIINQSMKNIEIILVNDGSTDNSLEICRKYARIDRRIVVIDSINGGIVEARKKGIVACKGDYIAFIDSDDWIENDMFENILGSSQGEDIISFGLIEEYGYKSIKRRDNLESGSYLGDEFKRKIIPKMLCYGKFYKFGVQPNLVCKLIKRELLVMNITKISDSVTMGEDGDFVYHALAMSDSLRIIELTPYHYVQRAGSLVRKETSMEALKALYSDLNDIGLPEMLMKSWEKQINAYFSFLLLLKDIQLIMPEMSFFKKLFNRRVIIYGAGNYGASLMSALSGTGEVDIVGVADRDWKELSQINPQVKSIDELLTYEYDMVYIAILDEDICRSVENMLLEKCVDKNKISYLNYDSITAVNIRKIFA